MHASIKKKLTRKQEIKGEEKSEKNEYKASRVFVKLREARGQAGWGGGLVGSRVRVRGGELDAGRSNTTWCHG